MAILKAKEIEKMNETEKKSKLKELKEELIKTKVGVKKGSKLTAKEIRKTIARLLTSIQLNKLEEEQTK